MTCRSRGSTVVTFAIRSATVSSWLSRPDAMDVPFKQLRPEGALPSTQHPGDAGLDLRAAIDATVKPGERVMVPTGVAVAIPDGHAGLVLPRSGLATARGLTLSNSPGLIESGYLCAVLCVDVHVFPGAKPRLVADSPGSGVARIAVGAGLSESRFGADMKDVHGWGCRGAWGPAAAGSIALLVLASPSSWTAGPYRR